MNQNPIVIFVCEHGAAKSIVAAAYFNQLANEIGSNLRAIARGTNPDEELSPQTIKGLAEDGLTPTEASPQKLTKADIQVAERVITFCDLPIEYQGQAIVERWENIPAVSENYHQARDVIIERIQQILSQ